MKMWTWLLLGLTACNGTDTGGTADDDTTDGNTDDNDDDADDLCRDVNDYEVDDLDACDQTWTALTQLANEARHCNTASDCWVADPQCEDWVAAECYIVLNHCICQTTSGKTPYGGNCDEYPTIKEFADHGHCTGDNADTCTGCPSPPDVACVNETCQFIYE